MEDCSSEFVVLYLIQNRNNIILKIYENLYHVELINEINRITNK